MGAAGFPPCEYPGDLVYTAALVANAPLLIRLVVIVETAGNWLEINEGPFCGVLTATENWLDKMVPGLTVSPNSVYLRMKTSISKGIQGCGGDKCSGPFFL